MINMFFYRHNKRGYAHEIPKSEIKFFELTLVLKGKLLYDVDGKNYAVGQNDAVFIKSGSVRSRKGAEGVDYVSFNFEGFEGELPTFLPDVVNNALKLMIAVCDEIHEKIYDADEEKSQALSLILALLYENLSASRENPVVLAIKQYLHVNLSSKINLTELASNVGYSPNYCTALFKRQVGMPIIEYLVNERIEEAKRLLAENILSLQQISEAVGFDDYNYFSRTFRKISGYSPTDYKRLISK